MSAETNISRMYLATTALRACQMSLIEKSEIPKKTFGACFEDSVIASITTKPDLEKVIPTDIDSWDADTIKLMFQRSLIIFEIKRPVQEQNPKYFTPKAQNNEYSKRIPPAEKEEKQPQGKTPRGKKRDNRSNNSISTSQSTVSPSTNTVAQSNKKLVFSRGTWIPPLATPITPSTMVAPPSVPSTLKEPPFGSPNYFQNRMMTSSAAPTQMTPPSWEPNGYQNQAFTPQTPTQSIAMNQFYNQATGHQNQPLAQTDGTLPNLTTPSAHDFSMNQHYQSFEMWNESQIDGTHMPPQHQSNTMPGYNFSQDNAYFGDIASMQMDNDFFPPSPY
ncbi:hypothetical protein CAEBREN_10736 [Caenorhabditis brenneri]|uniref:Uncharacterized protein n=1 Tax=Caenorhabditis brenneri TaxID=135651 RepID=G0NHZ5_CAEBE|nr:hypothetical protein CAEBREN_10736 [Caenorhabditis brenneri]